KCVAHMEEGKIPPHIDTVPPPPATTGQKITVKEVVSERHADMPAGFNTALGSKAAEVILADPLDLADGLTLVSPGVGDDRIVVSTGNIFIDDNGGKDSVVVFAGNDLASIDAITRRAGDASNPHRHRLYVDAGLFVATHRIENFTFAEGTYHLID